MSWALGSGEFEWIPRCCCIWLVRLSRVLLRRVLDSDTCDALGVPPIGEAMLRLPRRESKLERRDVVGEGVGRIPLSCGWWL